MPGLFVPNSLDSGAVFRCQANSEHRRQSRSDSGLVLQVKVLKNFEVVPSSLGADFNIRCGVDETREQSALSLSQTHTLSLSVSLSLCLCLSLSISLSLCLSLSLSLSLSGGFDPRAIGLSSNAKSVTPIARSDNTYDYGLEVRVLFQGSGFRVWGSGFRVEG